MAKGQSFQQEWLCHRKVHLCSLPAFEKMNLSKKGSNLGSYTHSTNIVNQDSWRETTIFKLGQNWLRMIIEFGTNLTQTSESIIYANATTEC